MKENQNIKKREYSKPILKKIGNIQKITLKAGSLADAFGGSYAP